MSFDTSLGALPPLPQTSIAATPAPVSSSSQPYLSVIIVNYQTYELTIQTITSVLAEIKNHSGQLGSGQVEIILVDNASPDGSGEKLKAYYSQTPEVIYLRSPQNNGFSAGNLIGYQAARGEIIFLLNSDTIVLNGSLLHLVQLFRQGLDQSHEYGVIACQLYNHDDGQIQPQGGDLPNLFTIFTQMTGLDDLPLIGQYLPSVQHTGRRQVGLSSTPPSITQAPIAESIDSVQENGISTSVARPFDITLDELPSIFPGLQPAREPAPAPIYKDEFEARGWVGGTALAVRRSILQKVGFLDTAIFMYGEDVEFCWRVKKILNLDAVIYLSAPIIHYGSASSSSKNAILGEFKGYIYLWQKNQPAWQLPFLRLILSLGALFRVILFSIIKRDKVRADIYRAALSEAWK